MSSAICTSTHLFLSIHSADGLDRQVSECSQWGYIQTHHVLNTLLGQLCLSLGHFWNKTIHFTKIYFQKIFSSSEYMLAQHLTNIVSSNYITQLLGMIFI